MMRYVPSMELASFERVPHARRPRRWPNPSTWAMLACGRTVLRSRPGLRIKGLAQQIEKFRRALRPESTARRQSFFKTEERLKVGLWGLTYPKDPQRICRQYVPVAVGRSIGVERHTWPGAAGLAADAAGGLQGVTERSSRQ